MGVSKFRMYTFAVVAGVVLAFVSALGLSKVTSHRVDGFNGSQPCVSPDVTVERFFDVVGTVKLKDDDVSADCGRVSVHAVTSSGPSFSSVDRKLYRFNQTCLLHVLSRAGSSGRGCVVATSDSGSEIWRVHPAPGGVRTAYSVTWTAPLV